LMIINGLVEFSQIKLYASFATLCFIFWLHPVIILLGPVTRYNLQFKLDQGIKQISARISN
jgi:hypothetical protein